jgi:hypothetical protein
MLKQIKRASPLILGAVALLIIWWIVDSSQAFQTCIYEAENSAANDPLQKIPVFVREFWVYRRCLGAYVIDKNAAITALGTLAIAVFTAILGGFTISLSKSTRIAAVAAKESADAAVAAERARFFIVIDGYNIGRILGAFEGTEFGAIGRTTPPTISYCFKNYGKTPGIIRETCLGITFAADPVIPVYLVKISSFPEYMIGADGSTAPKEISLYQSLTADQAGAISRNTGRLWFFGRMDYRDVFGEPQVHRFYFRTVMIEGECILQPYDYEHYNQSS